MMKILYLYNVDDSHRGESRGRDLERLLEPAGRFELEMTSDLDKLAVLPDGSYGAVIVNTTGRRRELSPAQERGLLTFVASGGGFLGIHSAADSFRGSRGYVDMLGGEVETYRGEQEFPVFVDNHDHYLTIRMPSFSVYDEMSQLRDLRADSCTVLAHAFWRGKQLPIAFVRDYGKGRIAYIALGHSEQVWRHPEFRRLVLRAIHWTTGSDLPAGRIRWGVVGYGGMSRLHVRWVKDMPGMEMIAVCDTDPACVTRARQEQPGLAGYYTSLSDMLAVQDLDLVTVVVPHRDHMPVARQCLNAGKHVIVEKPLSCTVAEANIMIEAAQKAGRTLSCFQQRRWDGDILAMHDILGRGLLGEIFHIESFVGGYMRPDTTWRSDREVVGSILHNWGPHFVDWILNMVPSRVAQVTGDLQKRVWEFVTVEDHGEAIIRFENGATASLIISNIAALAHPKWYILGTRGAITAPLEPWDQIHVGTYASGIYQESTIRTEPKDPQGHFFYRFMADHLLMGEEVPVTAESARRVVAVIEAAIRSAQLGVSQPVAPGCE